MKRKRIGVLTAGGDTPALNATIFGIVEAANRLEIEVIGLLRGYASLLDDRVPSVLLNLLPQMIPEVDPCWGGRFWGLPALTLTLIPATWIAPGGIWTGCSWTG